MRGQGGVGWDRKKFPESNLHVYGTDDTQIMVYNIRGWARKRDRKNTRGSLRKNYLTLITLLVKKILQENYSGWAEDNLFIL